MLKLDHLKSDFQKVQISNVSRFQMFPDFRSPLYLKNGPFDNLTNVYVLNTQIVRHSDPPCNFCTLCDLFMAKGALAAVECALLNFQFNSLSLLPLIDHNHCIVKFKAKIWIILQDLIAFIQFY